MFGITARFHMSHIVKSDAIGERFDILYHNDNHDCSVKSESNKCPAAQYAKR
jgi:hypothetical protein